MDILVIVVLVVLVYGALQLVGKKSHPGSHPDSGLRKNEAPGSSALRVYEENQSWLAERWALAMEDKARGRRDTFGDWYFDPPTDRQLERMSRQGLRLKSGTPTKGEASDIIGLFEEAEEKNEEVLRLFKVSTAGMNQTRARHEVALLMRDPEKRAAWQQRPASPDQLECLQFLGVPFTEGTSYETAAKVIEALLEDLAERGDPRATEWESYESLLASFDDRDELRDLHEIKRPSSTLLKKAIEELLAENISLKRLEDEPEVVRDRLLRLKPELARAERD